MRIKRFFLFALLILMLALMPAVRALASTQDFYFKDFTADYYLTRTEDGTSKLHVKEVLTAVFPEIDQNHGINRMIPIYNQNGKNRTIESEGALNLKVLRNGQTESVNKIVKEGDYYDVYIGNASTYVHGEQVYTLEYDFTNVITEFDQYGKNVSGQENAIKAFQELYWDTNGTAWSQQFDKVTARLHMPKEIRERASSKTSCYVGKYGSKGLDRCITEKIEDGFSFTAEGLTARENMTFAIGFKSDTFKVVIEKSYILVICFVIEVAIIAFVLIRKYLKWKREAKNNSQLYKATFLVPQYQPPEDKLVHVAEGEQILIGKAKPSYVATLLELAVTKAITITKIPNEKKPKKNDWSVHLNVEPATLSKSQLAVLKILANSDNIANGDNITIKKHTATRTLANYAKSYKKKAENALCQNGYLIKKRIPGVTSGLITTIIAKLISYTVMLVVAMSMLKGMFEEGEFQSVILVGIETLPIIMVILFLAAMVVNTIFSNQIEKYAKYTDKGIKLARYLDGLELYIKMAEEDRIKFLQSVEGVDTSSTGIVKLYEKLLPWASLFGVEKSWVEELNKYYQISDVPETISPDIMDGIIASNMLSSVSNVVAASTSYHESSSGGGGSSFSSGGGGGGFSGGGGGGGGGGGW